MKRGKGNGNGTDVYKEEKSGGRKTVYRIVKRKVDEGEAEGDFCYDLIVEEGEEICRLRDAARSRKLANALRKVFADGGVTPLEAPYILEDLMCSPEWID